MRAIPKEYRHIDWATYGLHWLLRFSENVGQDQSINNPSFIRTSTYRLFSDTPSGDRINIDSVFKTNGIPVAEKMVLLKSLSAGLRHAHRCRHVLVRVEAVINPVTSDIQSMAFEVDAQEPYFLDLVSDTELPAASDVLLQTGDPSNWFNLAEWSETHPIVQPT